MADKTKTVLVFESRERTVVRRTRRTASVSEEQILILPPERAAGKRRARWCAWWRAFARKGAAVFAPLSRGRKSGGEERNKGRL